MSKQLDETIAAIFLWLFGISVTVLMILLLVVGEENVSEHLVTALYIATLVTFLLRVGWRWLPRISFEKDDQQSTKD
ncbi:hypothetical protein [Glutamicibacter sp. NPDC087344]|uniref:hypothetical protein n=1 Tax=Glutamicibacter sp. NPDC087344 TaxID=3363994 RepID=UPI0037FAFCA0